MNVSFLKIHSLKQADRTIEEHKKRLVEAAVERLSKAMVRSE
jgi:hypothetical protein